VQRKRKRRLNTIAARAAVLVAAWLAAAFVASPATAAKRDPRVKAIVGRSLDWVAQSQSRVGSWAAKNGAYPTAMTAMAGMALLAEGSTPTQGKYQESIRRAVDYLINRSRENGLIGDPTTDDRYTYGHGFSLLFLSQVLGEEEDEARRAKLIDVLTRAVEFTGRAQTKAGGWGYVSAKDGGGFDEGSTTVTQIQGLRSCRNAGIRVPKEIVDQAVAYIHKCYNEKDGGIQYSSQGGSSRPAITAAAIACLYNAGEYDDKYVPKMRAYCDKSLENLGAEEGFSHWHYAHYYYSQVMYRDGGAAWEKYRDGVVKRILADVKDDGRTAYWDQGFVGPIYTTSINLTILQLDNAALPIYQR
jgi:hypothetical protein